jgi:hypothetical protein
MTVDELRRFVLSIDGMVESSHFAKADFRFRNKIVVTLDEAAATITVKCRLDEQEALVQSYPDGVTLPGGWAKHGWTTLSLTTLPDDELMSTISEAVDAFRPRPRSRPQ